MNKTCRKKVLVLDIDGTLTNSKKRSRKLPNEESGIFYSMVTGDPGFGRPNPACGNVKRNWS